MTTANCTYVINSQKVIGDIKMVKVTFTFTTYATNGKAFAPSLFGIKDFLFCPTELSLGKGFYHYDGTTLTIYVAYGTQANDNSDGGSCSMIMYGK